MENGKKCVIGGRLNSMFEGSLKLVFQDGELLKNNEHRHSCGGKVTLITMPKGTINAGAILACNKCNWRYAFDPEILIDGTIAKAGHWRLLEKLFGNSRGNERSFYCTICMETVIPRTDEKCEDCRSKEAIHADLPDDLKK